MTLVSALRSQWNFDICRNTASVSSKSGTFWGLSSAVTNTTSLNATVIPPPVKGCRIFIASPSRIIPGVLFVVAGKKEFGMLGKRSASSAFRKDGCMHRGRSGRTTFMRWAFTPPSAAEGILGMSTRARVSWVPI